MKKINTTLKILLLLAASGVITSCVKELNGPAIPAEGSSAAITGTKIYPESGGNGDTIKVTGQNFLAYGPDISISINGKAVQIAGVTDSTLKLIVPKMAGSGVVTFVSKGKTYTGPAFTYIYHTIVTTIAGSGIAGNGDGAGALASFNCPWGITTDDAGHLFIADCYNRLIRTVNLADNSVSTTPINNLGFASPYNIIFDHKDNSLYVTDFNQHLMKVSSGGALNVIYTGNSTTTGIAAGADGYLYMSNNIRGTIQRLNTSGGDTTIFASGIVTPRNIIFDKANNMYVSGYDAATASAAIFKVDNTGKATVVNTDAAFKGWEIAVDALGNFYEADHFSNTIKIIEKNGHVVTIAGSGAAEDKDGFDLHAAFNGPQGLTIDKNGVLYVSTYNYDTAGGNKIRKVVIE